MAQRAAGVQRQVQPQHMHPRLADEAQQRLLGVPLDQCAHFGFRQAAHAGHAGRLVVGRGAADVRVQPAGRGGDQVHRHRRGVARVGGAQRRDARLHRVGQRRVRRPQVGAGGVGGVVGHRRGRRRAAPEVLRVAEGLADQLGADHLAALGDQAAVGAGREGHLRDAGHGQRVDQTGEDRQRQEEHQGGSQLRVHLRSPQARPTAARAMSMSLMPMKGTITPPRP